MHFSRIAGKQTQSAAQKPDFLVPPFPLSTRTPSARKITVSKLLNKWPFKDLLTPLIVRKHLNNRQRLIMAAVERSGRTQKFNTRGAIIPSRRRSVNGTATAAMRGVPRGGDCRAPRAPHPGCNHRGEDPDDTQKNLPEKYYKREDTG